MSPEEENCRGGGSPPATGAALHQPHYPLSASPVTGAEPCLHDVKTPISAADTTTSTLDSKNVSTKFEIQTTSLNSIKNIADDVEKFDGKIVYNPNGSAYIFEGESELSEDDSLPDGCIVDGPGISISHSLVFPQIANAFYVSRLYAHQAYQQQNLQRGSSMLSVNTDLPVMHSYRVFSYRTSEGSTRPVLEIPSSAVPVTSVPVKPILMCFVCKLSFGFTKSFMAHAQSDHELKLIDDERQVLSHSTTSAIIQVVGKSKQPIISFLEPFSTSTYTQNLIDETSLQKSRDSKGMCPLESLNSINKFSHLNTEKAETNISSPLPNVSASGALTTLNLTDASYFIHKNQSINSPVSSSSRMKSETCVTTPTVFNHLKASPGCHSMLSQPQNFFSGTTIGVCPEHLQGRPSGIECSKCELILTSGRLSSSGSFTGIHSRNSCKTLKCPKCNWHYKYQETLEIHMKEKHPESETSCIYCIAGQPHPRLARGETYTCGYKPYRCEVCNYSTTTKGNLSIHMQSDKHLNNMQELQQTGNSSNFNNSASSQDQTITAQNQHHQANQNVLSSQISSSAKPKPLFRCDACNYETNVARNLRIHMTSEKHTHHMLVLQQNLKHIQTLSALQSHHQVQQTQIQHQKQHIDQILHFSSLGKPQHAEAALADMAYNQALLFQMITGGHLSSQTSSETFGNIPNLASSTNIEIDSGLSPDSMDPPPEPSDPDPNHLFLCCVCNNFSTDSVEDLRVHLTLDRTKICEEEMLSNISGHFMCKLCSYKTNLKANFQLHCKTDKHLQRLQHVNHVKEGGLQNEWKLKYITSPTSSAQIRCHACDYYTNSAHKLSLHAMSPKHEAAALLLRHLLEASSNISSSKLYHCALCSFSTKNRLPLLKHVKSVRHLQMEQLHQLRQQTEIQGNEIPHTDLGDVFRVIPDPHEPVNDSKLTSPSLVLSSTTLEKINEKEQTIVEDNGMKQETPQEKNELQDVSCLFCSFRTSSNEELKLHLGTFHTYDNDEGCDSAKQAPHSSFICPLCQDSFEGRSSLEKHVMQIHSVNSDGLQRLLVLVNQSHWLNNNKSQLSISHFSTESVTVKESHKDNIEYDNGSDILKCNICLKSFISLDELQQHQRESHSLSIPVLAVSEKHVYKYRCGQCSLAFKTLDKLQQHSQYHAIREATKCAICSRSFRSIQALSRHLEISHKDFQDDEGIPLKQSSDFLQAFSDENFKRQAILMNDHLTEDEIKVDDDESDHSDSLSVHKEQKLLEDYLNSQSVAEDSYNDGDRKFKCHKCKVAFTKQCYLTGHNKTLLHRKGDKMAYPVEKYLDPNRPFKCDVCKESFTQKNILLVHYNSVSHLHKLKRAMKEYKDNSFINISTTADSCHFEENHADSDKKPHKCNICKVAYSQVSTLDIHKRSVLHQTRASKVQTSSFGISSDTTHSNDDSRSNYNVLSFENNLNENDSNMQALSCSKCDTIFSDQDQLSNHEQSHCIINNPLSIFQQIAATKKKMICSKKNSILVSATSAIQEKSILKSNGQSSQEILNHPKHKPSQLYKHLLESFGYDLVMQFNENHQRKQRKEERDDTDETEETIIDDEDEEEVEENNDEERNNGNDDNEDEIGATVGDDDDNDGDNDNGDDNDDNDGEENDDDGDNDADDNILDNNDDNNENSKIKRIDDNYNNEITVHNCKNKNDLINTLHKEEIDNEIILKYKEGEKKIAEYKNIPEIKKSTCQHCGKEFSSVWVLKAHCEEVHKDLVPHEFLEKYAQHFKFEYDKKIVIVTAATSSSMSSAPITTSPISLQIPENCSNEDKEKEFFFENKENFSKTSEATSTTPTTTPALSNTPVSSTDSMTPSVSGGNTQTLMRQQHQKVQLNLVQHMSEMQAAFNAMAASQIQQLHQYPSLMMSMMGLPLGINVSALAAMNLQPPLVPVMLPTQPFDVNNSAYSSLANQSEVLTKQNIVLQQQQQQQTHQQKKQQPSQNLILHQHQKPPVQLHSVSAHIGASQKRARTRITDDQLKILRAHFDINNSPGEEQILDMAQQSGLPPKVIKHWFRNTLFKERQRNKDSPYNFNNPPSTTLNLEEYEKTGEAKVLPLDPTNPVNSTEEKINENQEKSTASSSESNLLKNNESKHVYLIEGKDQFSHEEYQSLDNSKDSSRPHSPTILSIFENNPSEMSSTPIMSPLSPMLPPKTTPQIISHNNLQGSNSSSNISLLQRCSSPAKGSDITFNCSHNGSSGSVSGKRANRTRFTDYQIKVLQEFFENNAYPKDDDLEYLSKLLGLSPRVIVVWFQNARQKARKVYENQPSLESTITGNRDSDEGTGRFQRTPGLNYQCKKCLLVFQRYYELIRHQKTHCFKEEDAKRSAQAQAAAAQVAAVLSSEDSNSSSTTTNTFLPVSSINQSNSEHSSISLPASSQQPVNQPSTLSQFSTVTELKNENFQCDKCNLIFNRFDLWREHQLIHIMNPALFPPIYPPDSAFGILQQQALSNSISSSEISYQAPNTLEKKRSFDDSEDGQAGELKNNLDDQPKDKRLRTTILPDQLDYLYQKYQIESNPSRKMLESIAREVGLKKRVVQVWFQNTRARERKGQFRAHSQVINKRCPYCPALFKVKSAFESHLSSKHSDQISRGGINIDNIPDEELSLESSPSNSSTSHVLPSFFPSLNPEVEVSLKKYYEESMKQYISELQLHASNGKQDHLNSISTEFNSETPLDLSKPNDLTQSVKISLNNFGTLLNNQSHSIQNHTSNDHCQFSDIIDKKHFDDDSMSETTDFLDDESGPTSPASSSQSSKQGLTNSNVGNNSYIVIGGSTTGSTGVGKRYRTQMSTTQIKVMKSLFSDYKTPTMSECELLGHEIGLPKRVVQVWFQNARAKEKKARLAAGLSSDGAIVQSSLTGPEECRLCSICYSSKAPLQEHIFSKKHIEAVRIAVEDGSLLPPTPGAPLLRESAIASSSNIQQGIQPQTEENMMYGSLFLHPTAMFQLQSQSQQLQQHTGNDTASPATTSIGECLADLLDS